MNTARYSGVRPDRDPAVYGQFPHHENLLIWPKLLGGLFPESIEARCRYAVHLAGREQFDRPTNCTESNEMIELCLKVPRGQSDSF
jgi:hypothetical protein